MNNYLILLYDGARFACSICASAACVDGATGPVMASRDSVCICRKGAGSPSLAVCELWKRNTVGFAHYFHSVLQIRL